MLNVGNSFCNIEPTYPARDLQHTADTRMIESGENIVAVSKILGHSDIKTTMRYTHPENSLKDALESLANFNKNATNIATNTNIEI